jgi:Bacterial PH domain
MVSSQQDQASEGGRRPDGSLPAPAAMPGPVPASSAPASSAPSAGLPGADGTAAVGAVGPGPRTPGPSRLQSAWKTTPDGKTVFRLMPPLVLWWGWVAFAAANLIDLAIQSPDYFSIEIAALLVVVTGVMYACTLRPRVISDADGLTIRNPLRDYHVPWGGVAGVLLGDSVEIQCERPAPKKPKTVYSWALYSPRRARARAELRVGFGNRRERDRHDNRARRRYEVPDTAAFGKMPDKAKEMATQHASQVMAAELARRCDLARKDGAAAGVLAGRWAWRPFAAVLIPIAAFVAVILAR